MTLPMTSDSALALLLNAAQGGALVDNAALAPQLASEHDAYRVQEALVAALDAVHPAPAAPAAWKSGGPSRTSVLTHSRLPAFGVRRTGADMAGLHLPHLGVEAEVALRLRHEVSAERAATLTQEEAAALVDAMCVSIEVVASRWVHGHRSPALLKLADLQSHGALVLGDWVPFQPRDWAAQRCRVRLGTGEWREWQGTHPLQDPAWLLPAWLRYATRTGHTVAAGTVVTTGSWCGLLEATAGQEVDVQFDGIGDCRCRL